MDDISSKVIELAQKYIGTFKISNNQLVAKKCPFCDGGAHGDENTFAIGLYNGQWNCMRGQCGKKGNFRALCEHYGERVTDMISAMPTIKTNKQYNLPAEDMLQPVTEDIITYMATRRISVETLEHFNISSDANGNIVFPFYRDGKLVYVKYRKPGKYIKGNGPKEWQDSNTEPILFGMDLVDTDKPLYITEGQIDAMSLYEAGITNVVSVPTGSNNMEWINLCWDWLEQFQQIIVFGDNDEPGRAMITNCVKRLGEERCLMTPEYPEMFDMNGVSLGRGCKDANEILFTYGKDKLAELANSCEPTPVEGLLNLADVQFVDPSQINRIYTRIRGLDNMIGGLTEGSVLTITGKRGCGKSTLNGTLLLNAIQQGHKVCAYSGELSAQNFLNWILVQATETKYISVQSDPRSGKLFSMVDPVIQKRIRQWIDGKFFLFDNSAFGDMEQTEAILKIFTIAAKKYGVDTFLCDNLMIALCNGEAEETKAQAKFAAALKAFATKYKATVILVAHPRKTKQGEALQTDDISGASAIGNLADTVISINKPNICVMKNREFGITGEIQCSFNPANRRIFETQYGDNTVYGWDHVDIPLPTNPASDYEEFAIKESEPPTGVHPF